MPTYIEPCLPKLVELAPTGERWIHEIKHDGYRLAVRIDAGDVRLLSRRGLNWTSRFPLVDQAARELRQKSVYIDGEVVIDGADGISDWPALHACASAGRCPGASLWAFDLLFLGGKDLRALPLVERKRMLAEILAPLTGGIRYVEFLEGDGRTIFEHACALGLEGIVSKLRDGRYRSGKSDAWRKTKCEQRSEFVVAGFIPNSGNKRAVGALVLAELTGGELKPAGKVGTGWTMKLATELAAALEIIVQPDPPFARPPLRKLFPGVRWVRPIVTVDVAHRGRTGDGLLRHPSFKSVASVQ
ncbi:DNA ligase D-like protein (predicted ligase) [Sinorhizobium fredii]|uniref:non-homologous end-joining DNA ligase n=1 Tax=Rhizobium fredii TaxID=380 RepID=UPI0035199F81